MKDTLKNNDRLLVSVCYLFIVVFCLLIIATMSEADEICFDEVHLKISASSTCGATETDCSNFDFVTKYLSTCYCTIDSQGCVAIMYHVCCPDTILNYEDDNYYNATVTGVESGHENEAAQAYFGSWASNHDYRTPAVGFQLTGYLEMLSWITEQGSVPGTVNVKTSGAKRGYFTADGQGTIIPIENISSFGTGTYSGGLGTGLSAFNMPSSFGTGSSIRSSFSSFVDSMSETALFSLPSAMAPPEGTFTNDLVTLEGGTFFGGTHSFHLSTVWGVALGILKYILLAGASVICVKIITKGGGG